MTHNDFGQGHKDFFIAFDSSAGSDLYQTGTIYTATYALGLQVSQ